jgi:hypothetical protein
MTTLSTPPSPNEPAPSAPDRGRFIACMIGLASVLFLSTAAVLYYRWAAMREPSCVIVIDAAPPLKSAEISVDSIMFVAPLKRTIGESNRYSIPFFVEPGEYQIKVTLAGEVQYEGKVTLSMTERGKILNLTQLRPTTMPISDPAT